jgi:hypothetical protein
MATQEQSTTKSPGTGDNFRAAATWILPSSLVWDPQK